MTVAVQKSATEAEVRAWARSRNIILQPQSRVPVRVRIAYFTAQAARVAQAAQAAKPADPDPGHDSPCVCGTYNRCQTVREADYRRTGDWRDLHRAYND